MNPLILKISIEKLKFEISQETNSEVKSEKEKELARLLKEEQSFRGRKLATNRMVKTS